MNGATKRVGSDVGSRGTGQVGAGRTGLFVHSLVIGYRSCRELCSDGRCGGAVLKAYSSGRQKLGSSLKPALSGLAPVL